jgi:transposase-like protein
MSRAGAPSFIGQCVHLVLRARGGTVLVRDEEDWRAFAAMARRMLFWCGGAIHGCRCEGGDIRLAITLGHAPIGSMVRHLSSAYSRHVSRRHGVIGGIFRHYTVNRVDADLHLDDLVIWLHRRWDRGRMSITAVWTADEAYSKPNSSDWITTDAVLEALGGASGLTYRRLTLQALSPEVIAALTRHAAPIPPCPTAHSIGDGGSVEVVARFVAKRLHISYDALCSRSRRRALSKAKVLTAILCARHGVPAAAVARLFKRSRSTLVEQVDYYRRTQPHICADAERLLDELRVENSRGNIPNVDRKHVVATSLTGALRSRLSPPCPTRSFAASESPGRGSTS